MPVDPVEIVVAGAGVADHLPGGHVAVATVDRIREEARLDVLDRQRKERLSVDAVQLEIALFEILQDLVFPVVREICEAFSPFARLAGAIQSGETLAVFLSRSAFRLRALAFASGDERRTDIQTFLGAVGPGQLPVDEDGAA